MAFTEFETRVLNAVLEMSGPAENLLREQLAAATGLDREFTGVGCYLHFTVPYSEPKLPPGRRRVGNVGFELEGIKDGGGALLWIEDGHLACLEVYLYGEEKWAAEPRITRLEKLTA